MHMNITVYSHIHGNNGFLSIYAHISKQIINKLLVNLECLQNVLDPY